MLAAIALVSSFWVLLDIAGAATRRSRGVGVAAFEERFNDFRKTAAPHAVYGYFSDIPPNDPSALAEFRLTQYTLAPAIIKPTPHENLVVVNYHSKQIDMKLMQANHLGVLQLFGNGVALCRGQKQ